MHHQRSCCAASPIILPATTLVPNHLGFTLWLSWPRCNPPHVSIVLVAFYFTHYQYVHVGLWGYVAVWLCARGVMWLCGCVHAGLRARGVVCILVVAIVNMPIGVFGLLLSIAYSEHAPIRFQVWGVALRMFLK